MRRGAELAIVASVLGATATLAPAAQAPSVPSAARATAILVEVQRPHGHARLVGIVDTRAGHAAGTARVALPADASLVSITTGTVDAVAQPSATRAVATATTIARTISLLGGRIRVSSLRAQAIATAAQTGAGGGQSAQLGAIVVDAKRVRYRPNTVVSLGRAGTLVLDETVDVVRAEHGRRGFVTALDLRLKAAYGSYPAGTQVLIGYADAAATAPAPATPAPAATTASSATVAPAPATSSVPSGVAQPLVTVTSPLLQAPSATGSSLGHDTSLVEQPPPGGFTLTPPISAQRRAQLVSGAYVFPVVGGARFTNDFGAPRSDTGFHQGIDLFAPLGTPLVAVHSGSLFLVGWNALGGRRLWLDDGNGNLFYYAHLSAFAPSAYDGARVSAGQIIGFAGSSGDAAGTPSHLHFEIHPAGGWAVPPFDYVTAWLRSTPGVGAGQGGLPAALDPANDVTVPETVGLSSVSDISTVSGLDPQALQAAAQGAPAASVAPDALIVDAVGTPPGFAGLGGNGAPVATPSAGSASPAPSSTPPATVTTPPAATAAAPTATPVAVAAVNAAATQLGVRYVWGGASPASGFDCSGLVQWAYAQVGVNLPRTAAQQHAFAHPIPVAQLQPGDLVFFNQDNHEAMYIGYGLIVQAPHTGGVVEVVPLAGKTGFNGAARVT